jgi:hypothetical protein
VTRPVFASLDGQAEPLLAFPASFMMPRDVIVEFGRICGLIG